MIITTIILKKKKNVQNYKMKKIKKKMMIKKIIKKKMIKMEDNYKNNLITKFNSIKFNIINLSIRQQYKILRTYNILSIFRNNPSEQRSLNRAEKSRDRG